MARSRQTRASRAFIAFVVIAIALGSVFQFHRLRRAAGAAPKPDAVAASTPNKPDPALTSADATSPRPTVPIVGVPSLTQTSSTSSTLADPTTRPANNPISNTPQPLAMGPSPFIGPPTSFSPSTRPSNTNLSLSSHPLADAKTKEDSGDLIAARKTLNDALLAGNLSSADTDAIKKQIAEINQTVIFSPKRFADDPFGGVDTVNPGQKLSTIAGQHDVTWEFLLRLNNMTDPKKLRAGQALKIIKGPFHVVVNKSKFNMELYLGSPGEAGSMYVTSYMVGLGKDDSTPTGTWMVEPHHKIKHPTYYSPRGEGVINADDPKNPLGPFWIGLSGTDGHAVGKASYGIHGTIEPDSIGKMSSMGCIRMHNEDVALVYEMVVEGKSTVLVKD